VQQLGGFALGGFAAAVVAGGSLSARWQVHPLCKKASQTTIVERLSTTMTCSSGWRSVRSHGPSWPAPTLSEAHPCSPE
jgi:hypothetical protein